MIPLAKVVLRPGILRPDEILLDGGTLYAGSIEAVHALVAKVNAEPKPAPPPRMFPILRGYGRAERTAMLGCPTSVPWDLLAPHEAQALRNHGGQSLERLAERGGLSPAELVAVVEDRAFRSMPLEEAVARVRELAGSAP